MTGLLDPERSTVEFSVQYLLFSTVRGQFERFGADISLDAESPHRSRVRATVDAGSMSTGNADRDAHLRSAEFLDVARFPTITFASRHVAHLGESGLWVRGDLTIHGNTREVLLDGLVRGPGAAAEGDAVLDIASSSGSSRACSSTAHRMSWTASSGTHC